MNITRDEWGVIQAHPTWHLDGDHVIIPSILRYDPRDPLVLHLTFFGAKTANWVIGRDLIATGMRTPAGLADIKITRSGQHLHLKLTSHDGTGVLVTPADDIEMFLNVTYDAVPGGSEDIDLDLDNALHHLFPIGRGETA